MTKHHSSATICLKRQFTKEDKLIPVITITVYLGTEGDNRLYRIQDIHQAAFRGTAECDKSVAEIADDLEEKEEVIAPIYEAALSMKPDYDVEKIYELLEKNKKLA